MPPKTIDLSGGQEDPRVRPGRKVPAPAGGMHGLMTPGQVVPASSLIPEERAELAKIGWPEGQDVPGNTADIIRQYQEAAAAELDPATMPPPVPLNTPPVRPGATVDLDTLPPAQRRGLLNDIKEALDTEHRVAAAGAAQREAVAKAGRLSPDVLKGMEALGGGIVVENDLSKLVKPPFPEMEVKKAPPPPPAPEPDSVFVPEMGGQLPGNGDGNWMTHCPHCNWALLNKSVDEPDIVDRRIFLQAMLGDKPFEKTYTLMDGELEVSFRTLSLGEDEEIHRQMAMDRVNDMLPTIEHVLTSLRRYRLSLQLSRLRAGDRPVMEFPDGLSHKTNPKAVAPWKLPESTPTGPSGVLAVCTYMQEHAFASSMMFSALWRVLEKFNLLVSKLEVAADRPDFWKPTES